MFYNIFIFASILIGMYILIFLSIVFGVLIIIYYLKKSKKEKDEKEFTKDDIYIIENLNKSINKANKVKEELSIVSKNIFEEIDKKYKGLLYIYNIIDEKEKFLNNDRNINIENKKDNIEEISNISMNFPENIIKEDIIKKSLNPKNDYICELYEKGYSIMEISKALNIGQGEIKLILDLKKDKKI